MKKRYRSVEQLEALIDKTIKDRNEHMVRCEEMEVLYKDLIKRWSYATTHAEVQSLTAFKQDQRSADLYRAEMMRQELARMRKHTQYYTTKLKRYKETLAVLRTGTFGFMDDQSVVLQ